MRMNKQIIIHSEYIVPYLFAFFSPFHSVNGTGGANLSLPTGGSANGIPRNASTGFLQPLA